MGETLTCHVTCAGLSINVNQERPVTRAGTLVGVHPATWGCFCRQGQRAGACPCSKDALPAVLSSKFPGHKVATVQKAQEPTSCNQ